jgi:RNA 2',3'-cyclic 3'-phosphodiesterase
VALQLESDVMTSLKARSIAMQEQFAERNIRWVSFENFHNTLIFIGNVPPSELDNLESLIADAVKGVRRLDISIGGATLFPPDNEKKGVLISSVSLNDALNDLQSRLDHAFRNAGYDLINRMYRPHITLARLKRAKMAQDELAEYDESFQSSVNQVHLYYTEKREGRVYNGILRSVDLI